MANQTLVNYINQYKGQYPVDSLKQQLLKQGYSAADIDAAVQETSGGAPPVPQPTPPPVSAPSGGSSGDEAALDPNTAKALAALAYPIGIISLILVIIAKKGDREARYHGFQALFWNIGAWVIYFVISFGIGIISAVLGLFGDILGTILGLLSPLISVAILIFSIIFALKAYKEEMFTIPLITGIMKSIVKDL
ncbi:MAG: DUF4870 domain-containing protein [archaeon]